jgi:hypothetical protein
MQMLYRKSPAVIAATSTVPDIPSVYHDYLEYYAVYVGWLARGDNQKAQMALEVFSAYEKDAAKTIGRRSQDGLLQIQEKRNSGRWW